MLAETHQADVTMAPAADMFELGVKVQVLKRGTMFALRAAKLYEMYRRYDRWKNIPAKQRETIEKDYLRSTFQEAWESTKNFFYQRDPKQVERAEMNPRHKMALVFRSYLGQSSNWANAGDTSRIIDYQIWCGPAMGAFNAWVKGSFLEVPANRKVVVVALNLLLGASVVTRHLWLRSQGVHLPFDIGRYNPLELDAVASLLNA
jgi:PfaD family protein